MLLKIPPLLSFYYDEMEKEYLPKVDPQTGVRMYVVIVANRHKELEWKTYFLQFFLVLHWF